MTSDDKQPPGPPDPDGADTEAPSVFAARLQRLRRTVHNHRRPGEVWSVADVVDEMKERGFEVSDQTIRNQLNKAHPNPTWRVLDGLATVFDVPADYFSSSQRGAEIADQVELALALRRLEKEHPGGSSGLLARMTDLSPASVRMVLETVERLHTLERGEADQ